VTSVQDLLDALGTNGAEPETPAVARHVPDLSAQESSVWQALGVEPRHVDELARAMKVGPGEVSAALAMLELRGLARQVGAMLYTRA
jgi:DNA processing protein